MISVNKTSKHEAVLRLNESDSLDKVAALFQDVVSSAYKTIIVDCSGLAHVGHQLLGKLYMLSVDLRIRGKKLLLTGCSQEIRSILHLTKIDERIEVFTDSPAGSQAEPNC